MNNHFKRVQLLEAEKKLRNKIKLKDIKWIEVLENKVLLFEPIVSEMLDYKNMVHLLTNMQLKGKREEQSRIYESVNKHNITEREKSRLAAILNEIGIGSNIDIYSDTTSGDIGEYIMNIILLSLYKNEGLELIMPKLVLKTNKNMPVFGDDNIYFDLKNNILYLGEAKFYKDLRSALTAAQDSIQIHLKIMDDFAFLEKNTNIFKYNSFESYEEIQVKIEEENLFNNETTIKSIIFVMAGKKYLKSDIETILSNYNEFNGYVIILPIIDKDHFLQYYKRRVMDLNE